MDANADADADAEDEDADTDAEDEDADTDTDADETVAKLLLVIFCMADVLDDATALNDSKLGTELMLTAAVE